MRLAIVSNKDVATAQTALANNGLGGYIPESLNIGDKAPEAERKPALVSFTNVLVLGLREIGHAGPWLETGQGTVVVGGTKADIEFARSIGGESW